MNGTEGDEFGGGPWPALSDLLAATSLLFLTLFAVIALPALAEWGKGKSKQSTLDSLENRVRAKATNVVKVDRVGDYLRITIGESAVFLQGQSSLASMKQEGKDVLEAFAEPLREDSNIIDQIQVVGHASSEGAEEENYRLSAERAVTVALYLTAVLKVPICRVTALGRGRHYPLDPDSARLGKHNPLDRRIELEIRPFIPSDTLLEQRRNSCVDYQ